MRALLSAFIAFLSLSSASATEDFAASFRLRGGYDSNPLLAPMGKGSSLVTWEAAGAYGRDNGEWVTGATGEIVLTRYREEGFEPVQNYRLRLRLANKEQNDVSFDATTTFSHFSAYDTRSDFVNQRIHVQWVGNSLRPFVASDLRLASLNELNVLLGEFLPKPMRYLRGTITPGIAYVKDKTEIGVSVALEHMKYEDDLDLFGYRRNNDRVQPRVHAIYGSDNLSWSGAISLLRSYSQDEFFTDVNAVLFETSLAAKWEGWSADVAIARTAEDTTFPVSPVTINTSLQAKLMHEIDAKTSAGIFGRVLQRKYWDTPLFSRVRIAGVEANYQIAEDILLATEVGFARSLLISGAESDGVIATLALTRRFSQAPKK